MNKVSDDILQRIYDRLTDGFIVYQHRLDNPWPSPTETKEALVLKYRNDQIFHQKVDSIVSGVLAIVGEELMKDNQK